MKVYELHEKAFPQVLTKRRCRVEYDRICLGKIGAEIPTGKTFFKEHHSIRHKLSKKSRCLVIPLELLNELCGITLTRSRITPDRGLEAD